MNSARAQCFFLAIILSLSACAARQPGAASSDRNLLSSEEMQKAGYVDGLLAVQTLRPLWLRMRGPTSSRAETIKVYLDGSLLGGPEQLRQIRTSSISSMRYYDGLEATQRWGLDHGHGAIVVSTRR
jgi:hypothetical protein